MKIEEFYWMKNCIVLYITLTSVKLLHIMFDKVDGFSRDYDGTKHLILFGPEKCDAISIGLDIL